MRFKSLFPVCVLLFGLVSLTGCPGDDDGYCGDGECDRAADEDYSTCPEDCVPVCGDGDCNLGENDQNCPADCDAGPVCGDSVCNGSENSSNCPGDCVVDNCTDPNFPVDCEDNSGVCWSPGTNCASNWFSCSGLRRCASTSDWAFCCSNTFATCPAGFPYYCPQDNLCYSYVPNCNTGVCSLILGDC